MTFYAKLQQNKTYCDLCSLNEQDFEYTCHEYTRTFNTWVQGLKIYEYTYILITYIFNNVSGKTRTPMLLNAREAKTRNGNVLQKAGIN